MTLSLEWKFDLTRIHEALPGWKRSILSPAEEIQKDGEPVLVLVASHTG